MKWLLFSVAGIALLVFGAQADAADANRGETLYSRCAGCHSLDQNRIGPRHRGVYGRRAGAVPDFDYSAALSASTVVWNDASLDAWLANPQAFIPGQKMFFRVQQAADRADLIAYLRQVSTE